MGSDEMAVLNVVHGNGEYWELWHGDGMNPQTSAAIESAWQEGKKLGYGAYKEKLVSEGHYQEQRGRGHRGGKGKRGRRNAGLEPDI